ncbi:hypothetical protein Q3W71_18190 [Micromonospora sp. C28SCA-DRY-2]|uniref:hypothetical protein n=1 Tax=Micromonospora sp. C28SCA-DRY-2 TaxID=3059522 RepID=UPI00267454B8|nr:hypothetical protein [Micromonospora sp. C28SCA-DRY-2]MDO3703599.1 hypothetical protein [Micromonospora sp. C28SCA-DRY-2]
MNEVDQLRQAMRATERTGHDPLDLTTIMREGRRLRHRRRLAGTGAAAVLLAVVAGVTVTVRQAAPPEPERSAAPAVTAPAGRPSTEPAPTPVEPRPVPLGDVVDSGIRYGTDARVFYFVAVDLPHEPRVTIGLVAGRRAADGTLTSDFLANDVEGSDRRPGFHQIGYDSYGAGADGPPMPTFGYFVGPASRIVGTVKGRQVDARLARWSEDPRVVIFWFDPQRLAPGVPLDGIIARDAQGRKL